MKKIIASIMVVSALSGCAGLQPLNKELPTEKAVMGNLAEAWNEPEAAIEGLPSIVLYTPEAAPSNIQSKHISLTLRPNATLNDLSAIMAYKGISLVISDKDVASRSFYLPRFDGTIGQLLNTLSTVTNTHFVWLYGALYAVDTVNVGLSIPQDEFVAEKVEKGLGALKVTGLTSQEAGLLVATVKANQLRDMRALVRRITDNAAIVTTQVAVMSVNLTKDQKEGIDWSKLQMGTGSDSGSLMNSLNPSNTTAPAATATTPGTTTPVATAAQVLKAPIAAGLLYTGGTLRGALDLKGLTMIGFMNMLKNEVRAETLQNMTMKISAGGAGTFKSNTKVPYVKSVSAVTTGTTTASTTGSATFDTANDGMTLDLKPTYDSHAGTVGLTMGLKMETVMGYKDLNAGNGVGTVTQQPITAERTFDAKLRVRPGQLSVVGGLVFDQVSDSRTGLPILNQKFDGRSLVVNRYELFVILRPTVSVLGAPQEKPTGYDALPAAAAPIDEELLTVQPVAKESTETVVDLGVATVSKPDAETPKAKAGHKATKSKKGA